MWTFSAWAPKASKLDVLIDGKTHPLKACGDGWWRATLNGVSAGADYLFSVDGGSPVPDPRSLWQPAGVHGASRTYDHSAFQWSDHEWQPRPLPSAIIYELHVGTFTPEGTFESIIPHLDYLKALGITHVELMPVNEFSGDWGWGYDGVNLFAPHHAYGPPEGLKHLVDACHSKGFAVLLDVVYNHLGPTGNYLSKFGPYFTDRYSTPWGEAVNLDGPGSVEVRRFFLDNALMWLRDYRFDGLRLDAIHAIVDTSALHFLEQLSEEVRALETITGRRKVLIAESDLNDARIVSSPDSGGYGIDAQWSDDFHHALHSALTGETSGYYEDFGGLEPIGKALAETFVYDGVYAKHRGRAHGRPAVGVSSHRFLGYLQTHDQVGNRARGERISHIVSLGKAKIGAALVLTSPFIPMLFQGEEFGASSPFQYFTHHEEETLGRAVSEGRRREFAAFGWKPEEVPDPQDSETFQRSKLNWSEIHLEPHHELLEWYRALIRLRKTTPALAEQRGRDLSFASGDNWLSVRRGSVSLFCNLSAQRLTLPVEPSLRVLLASHADAHLEGNSVHLPSESAILLIGPDSSPTAVATLSKVSN